MRIRAEQMRVFEEDAPRRFENEMMAHGKSFSPRLCEVIGDEQLQVAIRSAIDRAGKYGFTNRGPIRLCIELMFLCGSAFDTDPQYPELGAALNAHDNQMARAERMHQSYNRYLENVGGPDNIHMRQALRELSAFAREPINWPLGALDSCVLREMNRIFPAKAAYVGEVGLKELIIGGIAEAQKHSFTSLREIVLIVVLMFAFGHGCTADPLYPWIAQTLRDPKISGPAGRAERLEKKARTWLDHVLVWFDQGRLP